MNSPPYGPFDALTVPSLSRDFDSGPAGLRSGLARVSLEPFGRLRVPSIVEGQAAPQRVETCRHAVMSEDGVFVNNPG